MSANKGTDFISGWPIALCLVVLSFLTSCEKDDTNPSSECRISKLSNTVDPTSYSLYQYDKDKKLQQVSMITNGKESRVIPYEYNSQGQVNQITLVDKNLNSQQQVTETTFAIYTFEYNTLGQVAKFQRTDPNNPYSANNSETVCEYDVDGNRTRTITTSVNSPTTYISAYTYVNGNCIKSIISQGLPYESIREYEFDLTKEN